MLLRVYPYGPDVQRHFEEMSAAGKPWAEASEESRVLNIDWPDCLRLPVRGDSLSVKWASGYVSSVTFIVPEMSSREWYIVVHLSHDRP